MPPSSQSTLARTPCSNCREKHVRCDKQQPTCTRCKEKGLICRPVQRKSVFRQGSTARLDGNFSKDQSWMSSQPKKWKLFSGDSSLPESLDVAQSPTPYQEPSERWGTPTSDKIDGPVWAQRDDRTSPFDPSRNGFRTFVLEDTTNVNRLSNVAREWESVKSSESNRSINGMSRSRIPVQTDDASSTLEPGQTSVQEACLLRHFIEEISPWFDHCDDRRHFQLVVPRRAQYCSIIRNAIFAVSARHLARLPQYATPQGVCYRGQLLPDLEKCTAVEYTLKCIPELLRFPEITDPTEQENIMVATVILRQYEEMEEDIEVNNDTIADMSAHDRVNFLAITQRIIDAMISHRLEQSLATAAYWIVIRQEVYYALTRQRPPKMRFSPEDWGKASAANTLVMLASEVTKWRWGVGTREEWNRLMLRHRKLKHDYHSELAPIFEKKADRSRGELFPTIWYSSDEQVTAVQHLEIASMILTAQNPYLSNSTRAAHRKAEAEVRSILLRICGIAVNHTHCHPASVTAVISISLYGEYFTEPDEREALVGIINQTRDLHSWPMQKCYARLRRGWEEIDNCSP
ncbi:transcriptional regulator family: Fungal Specific TF [Aspergillus niger]|nr:transcriptional regulator family: Fungal Specific TF [Aspergillus niger]KAI2844293.1 transcriptional regulator family: Fungal Specific TF [Aspergillus niger]KAI2899751.1 transcriptional regulator family: Fungal Specific TF [Aspergillus niger]KAI2928965.1 transcriptional regulator family: Fungal Specific TF [Aspergillus niger]KAI2942377.1 transcriptional regulator family: Fungal Specific TF [Aspergillus niger]